MTNWNRGSEREEVGDRALGSLLFLKKQEQTLFNDLRQRQNSRIEKANKSPTGDTKVNSFV